MFYTCREMQKCKIMLLLKSLQPFSALHILQRTKYLQQPISRDNHALNNALVELTFICPLVGLLNPRVMYCFVGWLSTTGLSWLGPNANPTGCNCKGKDECNNV